MQDQTSTPIEDPVKAEKRGPIPLADRRRLMRQSETNDEPKPVFNDWASI